MPDFKNMFGRKGGSKENKAVSDNTEADEPRGVEAKRGGFLDIQRLLVESPEQRYQNIFKDDNISTRVKQFITRAEGALRSCEKYQINLDHDYRKRVTGGLMYFQQIDKDKVIYNSKKVFEANLSLCSGYLESLIDSNSQEVQALKNRQQDARRTSSHEVRYPQAQDAPEARYLFSGHEIERHIAEETFIARKYHAVFRKRVKKPDVYTQVGAFFRGDQRGVPSGNDPLLSYMREMNRQFRNAAMSLVQDTMEESAASVTQDAKGSAKSPAKSSDIKWDDLNPLQRELSSVVGRTKTYSDWVEGTWREKYSRHFDFEESWLQKSLQLIGIRTEDVKSCYQDLHSQELVRDVFYQNRHGQSANDIAYHRSPDQLVSDWETLERASMRLNYIQSRLAGGFPVDEIPKSVCGLRVDLTSGADNNCLIHSWLKVSTDWDEQKIIKEAKVIRGELIDRIHERLKSLDSEIKSANMRGDTADFEKLIWLYDEKKTLSVRVRSIENGAMLDQGSHEGRILIECLVKRELIDPDRGLWIYRFERKRVNCVESEVMPRKPGAELPPYTFALRQNVHFNAMLHHLEASIIPGMEETETAELASKAEMAGPEVVKLSSLPKTAIEIMPIAQRMSKIYEMYRYNHTEVLGRVLGNIGKDEGYYQDLLSTVASFSEWGLPEDLEYDVEQMVVSGCKDAITELSRVDAAMPSPVRVIVHEQVPLATPSEPEQELLPG